MRPWTMEAHNLRTNDHRKVRRFWTQRGARSFALLYRRMAWTNYGEVINTSIVRTR